MIRGISRLIGAGITNLGIVKSDQVRGVPGGLIYRSAKPDSLDALTPLGIKTVLDLEEGGEPVSDSGPVLQLDWPLTILSDITPAEFDKILDIVCLRIYWPLLIHCAQGRDRTGAVCAAYRIAIDGWTLAEALEEMESYGGDTLLDIGLKACLQRYAKYKNIGD